MLSAKPTRYPGAFFMDDHRRSTRLHEQTCGAQRCLCNSVQFLRVEQDGVISALDIKSLHCVALLAHAACGSQARMAPHTGGGQSKAAPAVTPTSILAAASGGKGAVFRSLRSTKALIHSKMADRLPRV